MPLPSRYGVRDRRNPKLNQSELPDRTTSVIDLEVALENAVERFEEEARVDFEEVALPRYL